MACSNNCCECTPSCVNYECGIEVEPYSLTITLTLTSTLRFYLCALGNLQPCNSTCGSCDSSSSCFIDTNSSFCRYMPCSSHLSLWLSTNRFIRFTSKAELFEPQLHKLCSFESLCLLPRCRLLFSLRCILSRSFLSYRVKYIRCGHFPHPFDTKMLRADLPPSNHTLIISLSLPVALR